ncbi:hypothetical protein J4Q44_G00333100 [Coregonus suidteri]|uniref:RING-type E3 ubiquitin transferase n=1 Tax=Coregonus suidteri TaxID=861788 RepID=A0AAN8QMX9_9TELE
MIGAGAGAGTKLLEPLKQHGDHRTTGVHLDLIQQQKEASTDRKAEGCSQCLKWRLPRQRGMSQGGCPEPTASALYAWRSSWSPVTLPCGHTFCKPCFLETVDKSNLCCPLCRKRVSTWARLNGRNKTLVNDELWRRVQVEFPMQCQRRLSGQEEVENISVPGPKVSLPGEVRREYEDQISKLLEEKRALEEAEKKASEEYIQCLLAEESLAEERKRHEEKQLENDEKLARLLCQELVGFPHLYRHTDQFHFS